MTAGEILLKTRLYLNDMNKTTYSDFQIIEGVNDAMRMLAEENARSRGPYFRKRISLSLTDGEVSLPDDFLKEVKGFDEDGTELFNVQHDMYAGALSGEFGISGSKLMSGDSPVVLWYFAYPSDITGATSQIDLPLSFIVPIAKIAASVVVGSDENTVTLSQYFLGVSKAS